MRHIKNFEDVKEQILFTKNWADLLPVLPKLKARKLASKYLILCPFRRENHASCFLFEKTRNFHCFGCGQNGNMISFFSKIEKITYFKALVRLAKLFKIKIEWEVIK